MDSIHLLFSLSGSRIWFCTESVGNVGWFVYSHSVRSFIDSSEISILSFRWIGSNTSPPGDGQGTQHTDRSNMLLLTNQVRWLPLDLTECLNYFFIGTQSKLECIRIFKWDRSAQCKLSWKLDPSESSQSTTKWSSTFGGFRKKYKRLAEIFLFF